MEGRLTPDWEAPWYDGWRDAGQRVQTRQAQGAHLSDALNAEQPPAPVHFAPQSALPQGVAYERFIFEQRQCPTRENLHDFFNGLCWLRFPQAKSRLNEQQAREIERDGIGSRRGPVRDAITLFDENGALLDAPAPVWEALRAREWRRLFVDLRPMWAESRLVVFGHALLEKLAQPRKDLTAHVWAEPCPPRDADGWLAARLDPARLAAKPYTPLPVLGIPGWWAPNLNFSFYDDSVVFRPRRAAAGAESAPPHP